MIKQLKTNKMKNLNYTIMRKIAFALLMLLTLSLNAQNDNVIKFMGIPIDGPKSEMISRLEEVGFVPSQTSKEIDDIDRRMEERGTLNKEKHRDDDDFYYMQGYFDGNKCNLFIFPYKKKVYKIMVHFDQYIPYREFEAKQLFNHYVELLGDKYKAKDDNDSYYIHKDIAEPINAHYFAYYLVTNNSNAVVGTITLEMTHPAENEFHLAFYYCNTNNMPNGEDL